MSFSSLATEQREREEGALRSFLTFSLIGSLALHTVVLALGNSWSRTSEKIVDEPIEVLVVDPPNLQAPEPKEETQSASGSKQGGSSVLTGSGSEGGSIAASGGTSGGGSTSITRPPQSDPSTSNPRALTPAPRITQSSSSVAEKQPTPITAAPIQQLAENIKPPEQPPKPAQTPPPEVAAEPKPIIKSSPIPLTSPKPASTSQPIPVAVNQPPQKLTSSVPNSPSLQNREQGTEKLRDLLTGVRNSRENQQIAANSTAPSNKPSGAGTRQANVTGSSGNAIGSRFGTATGNGLGSASGTKTGTGNSLSSGTGRGSSNGSRTGTGTGNGLSSGSGSGRGSGNGNGSGRTPGSGSGTQPRTGAIATGPRRSTPGTERGNSNGDSTSRSERLACRNCSKPKYPEKARRRGQEGRAEISVDVDDKGKVTNVRLARSSGHSELDQAAIREARRWKFKAPKGGRQGIVAKVDFAIEGSERSRQVRERRKQREATRRNRQNTPAATAERSTPTRPIRTTSRPSARSTNVSTASPRRTQSATPRRRRRVDATPRRSQQATPRSQTRVRGAATPRRSQQATPSQTRLRQSLRRQPSRSQQAKPASQTKLRQSLRIYQQRSQSAPKPANSTPDSSQ